VERVVDGYQEAYAIYNTNSIDHHGPDIIPEARSRMRAVAVDARPDGGPVPVLDEDGLKITAFAVNHEPIVPAYGYRFDYRGRSIVVSGDTAKSKNLIAAAHGADVLIHEAQANHMIAMIGDAAKAAGRDRVAKIMADIPSYHTTPVEAAEAANEAGVRLLVMYHLNPPPPNRVAQQVFLRGVGDVRPSGWMLGDDGTIVELPADSTAVDVRHVP
jgi:ribonuclease Z